MRIITGIQPSGSTHLGNLFGAIKPLVGLIDKVPDAQVKIFIADYHAITVRHDPHALIENTQKLAAMLMACGFSTATVFRQSHVREHTELAWVLQCTASRVGWLNRMTQFREKAGAGEHAEGPSVGLYTYPVLQAADILLHQAELVPVGEDQQQHLNLAVDIAEKFNREFGKVFAVPKPLVTPNVGRIMSLTDASKKMSKSDENEMSRIDLDDAPDVIAHKIKRATTDIPLIPATFEEIGERRELRNLLTIYAAVTDLTFAEAVDTFAGKGYGALKPALTDALVSYLEPIRTRYHAHMKTPEEIATLLVANAEFARDIARNTMHDVRHAIGIA